jgi:hypothetical protein
LRFPFQLCGLQEGPGRDHLLWCLPLLRSLSIGVCHPSAKWGWRESSPSGWDRAIGRPIAGLAQVQESGGSGGETGSGRGLGELILERSLAVSLFANRFLGKFSRLNSSASRASRVHVRAMSSRTSRTRALGARSANCWQSYERFLHIAGVSTAKSPSVGYPTQNGGAGVGGAFPSETRTRDSEIGSARANVAALVSTPDDRSQLCAA